MTALRFLVQKEFLQIFRDKATMAQLLMVPILQLLVLSNAATFAINQVPITVVDHDHSIASVALANRLEGGGQFRIKRIGASTSTASRDLVNGTSSMVLEIPRGFEQRLSSEQRSSVQLAINSEEGAVAGLVSAYAREIISDFARASSLTEPDLGIDIRSRSWYNATRNYKHYMVPAILVSLITIIGTLVTAQSVARERELGTLEQLNVTPLAKSQFLAGKLIPAWISGMVVFVAGLGLGRFLFDVPMRGSVLIVLLGAAIYLIVALGIGLFVSTITRTQQQAMFVSFFLLMIYLLMSGMFTPIESMPRWAQWIGATTPVRHFVWVMRAVLVRGAGLDIVWPVLAGLAVSGSCVLAMAVRLHKKTVD